MIDRASIEALLDTVPHERLPHPPGASSEAIAELRGTPLSIGAKCLWFKSNKGFLLVVVQASEQVEGNHFRKQIGVRRLRFATTDELLALTGLAPGCIPPFAQPFVEAPIYADTGLLALPRIAFTAADPTLSIRMPTDAWRALADPKPIQAFARPTP